MNLTRKGAAPRRTAGGTMSATSALVTLVLALAVAFGLSLVLKSAQGNAEDTEPAAEFQNLQVEWDYRPESLEDLTAESPAIVLAEVEAVRQGPSEWLGADDPDFGPPTELPTQLIDLEVVDSIEGTTPAEFTVRKVGGSGVHPDDAPAYRVGERYLLFVRPALDNAQTAPHPDGTWVAVAPDGRLERLPSGELDAVADGPVADILDGETLADAIEEIEEAHSDAEAGQ